MAPKCYVVLLVLAIGFGLFLRLYHRNIPVNFGAILQDGGHYLILRDGRIMEYFESGDLINGKPLIFFHGTMTSGYQCVIGDWLHNYTSLGLHVICPSLPGWGWSDLFPPDKLIVEYHKDFEDLLNHLGLKKVMVMGASLGTMFSAVVTAKQSSRVSKVGLFAGVAPYTGTDCNIFEDFNFFVSYIRLFPAYPYVRELIGFLAKIVIDNVSFEHILVQFDPEYFQFINETLGEDTIIYIDKMTTDLRRAHTRSHHGNADTSRLVISDWGFNISEISNVEKCLISSGLKDTLNPPKMQLLFKEKNPKCLFRKFDEGHLHVFKYGKELLLQLLEM